MLSELHLSKTAVFVVALFIIGACTSTSSETSVEGDEPPVEEPAPDPFTTAVEDADEAWEDRGAPSQADRSIAAWNRALETAEADERDDGEIAAIYESLARAHYFVARYLEADGPDVDADSDIDDDVDAGLEAAVAAIELRAPDFRRAIDAGAPFESQLPEVPDGAVDAFLWYAKLLALHTSIDSVATGVANTPLVDSIMESIAERAPEAHHGAAHRYFGVRHVDRPLHRDEEASRQAFDESLDTAPDFLMTRLLRARFLATFTDDRAAFEDELQTVADSAPDILPEAAPENAVVRQWAADILERGDEFFDN